MLRSVVTGAGFAMILGCQSRQDLTLVDLRQHMTIAVAPALNHSGSPHFDSVRAADLMASELTREPGVNVVAVNRVLAQLATEGKSQIESPAHALQVMERVGADAIIVFAVTEYNPYHPPVVGISAQMYGYGPGVIPGFDPVVTSRQVSPDEAGIYPQLPRAESQRIYDASDENVIEEIQYFARNRNADESPMQWRKFVQLQDEFMRFCCSRTLREMIHQEVIHLAMLQVRNKEDHP